MYERATRRIRCSEVQRSNYTDPARIHCDSISTPAALIQQHKVVSILATFGMCLPGYVHQVRAIAIMMMKAIDLIFTESYHGKELRIVKRQR